MRKKWIPRLFLCLFESAGFLWAQTNLLQNPGFESWPSAASVSNWVKESGVTLTKETVLMHGGSASAKMQMTGVSESGLYQDVAVSAGSAYTFKAWLFDGGGTAKIGAAIIWYDGAKKYLSKYAGPEKTTVENVWQQVSVSATAPAGAGYARCRIRVYDSNDAPCYADDTAFYEDLPLSVTVRSCQAVCLNEGVVVSWKTEGEVGTVGFHVRRAESESGDFRCITTALIPGQGNTSSGKTYVFIDRNVETGKTYWYRIEEWDTGGNRRTVGTVRIRLDGVGIVTHISELQSVYPNPFNPETAIRFCASQEDAESGVSLVVYNVLGEQIKVLIRNQCESGETATLWDGRDGIGRDAPAGLYFCVLQNPYRLLALRRMVKIR
ncbi:MAG TPA: hypothetical protein VGB38_07915 [bacterium]